MSAAFGQHEMWQQHIQMQLQLQQQQDQQQASMGDLSGGNRKRVLATEADEFMGIKKRNLGSETAEQGIYGMGGFSEASGTNTATAQTGATSGSFPGLGVSPSASMSSLTSGFLTPTIGTATTTDRDYFGLPPTSQPNHAASSSFPSRQEACNSSSAPATPSISFSGGSSSSGSSVTTQPSLSNACSTSSRFGWSNHGGVGGGAMSNPSTPLTESTVTMLYQNSFNLQQIEEQQLRTQALQMEEKHNLQRTQLSEQRSLHAAQQRELEALQRQQREQAVVNVSQAHPGAGASFNQHHPEQTMEMDQTAASANNAIHDNNDPATWGFEQSSSMQLQGYLSGQGRGYTPAAMGVAALAAAAAMAQNQRSQQRPTPLVAPVEHHHRSQFDEGVGMDMDMGDGTVDLWTMFDANEQEAMTQTMMRKTHTRPIPSSSLLDISPPPSIVSNAMMVASPMDPFSSSSSPAPLSSSSLLPASSTVFPTLGQEPLSNASIPSPPPTMMNSHSSLQAQGLGHFQPHPQHHSFHQHPTLATSTTSTTTNTDTFALSSLSMSSPAPLSCPLFLGQQQQQQQQQQHLQQQSSHHPLPQKQDGNGGRHGALLSTTLLDKPSPPNSLSFSSAPNSRVSTPRPPSQLSTSQYQYVMGFRPDCERCQRREKGHVAHLVSKDSPMR